jgi:hypothetical protein
VAWQQAQRESLRQFVQALEKRLAEQTGRQR